MNATLKKVISNFKIKEDAVENYLDDIVIAIVFTVILTASVSAYIIASFSFIPELGKHIGLYILANLVLLIKFIYQLGGWTVEELGNELHNYIQARKDANDL